MACSLRIADRRFSGIVLDVSDNGLFIQTTAKPDPLTAVEVRLTLPGMDRELVMQAEVARKKLVPPQLQAVAQGGLGLLLIDPPEEYRDYALKALPTGTFDRTTASSAAASRARRSPKRSAR